MSEKLKEKINELATSIVKNPYDWDNGKYEFGEDLDVDLIAKYSYDDTDTILNLLIHEKVSGKNSCIYLMNEFITVDNVVKAMSILEIFEKK